MSEGKKGFFGRLVEGLAKTRNNIVSGIDSVSYTHLCHFKAL